MDEILTLDGRAAMHRAIADARTPMSRSLAEKLDALTDEEWDELTRWLTARVKLAAAERGIHFVRIPA